MAESHILLCLGGSHNGLDYRRHGDFVANCADKAPMLGIRW